jgi:virginiamycin A acetyltransferase
MIEIAESARISSLADIEDSQRGTRIIIGANSVIDSFVKIKPAGGTGDVVIGEYCYINSGTVVYTGHGVQLGNHVLIAANCTLAATNHEFASRAELIRAQGFQASRGGIVIEDDVWIGASTVILDGARLRRGCVVGANSLVMGELDAYSVYVGSPVRKIGRRE